jgi:hypothetical protein
MSEPAAGSSRSPELAHQPYFAGVERAVATSRALGAPLASGDEAELVALSANEGSDSIERAEAVLDRYTLARVELDREGYGRTSAGAADRVLVEQGWQVFLVRVHNPHRLQRRLLLSTMSVPGLDQANLTVGTLSVPKSSAPKPSLFDRAEKASLIQSLWLSAELDTTEELAGFPLEYRVVQIFSRDRGERSAYIGFSLVDDAQSIKFGRQGTELIFDCLPSRDVQLNVLDADGLGCVASHVISDDRGRIYPPQAMRLAPDMRFHPQIYRGNGETVRLPDGDYTIESRRGPEYLPAVTHVRVSADVKPVTIGLTRWVDPAQFGWYPGETHIHAAGCSHYETPTEGVDPETMIRHVRGEALAVGNVLTWGPCYYYQRQFFTGHAVSPAGLLEHPDLQVANNATWVPTESSKDQDSVLRYDVEISGFPSSHAGHLVLVRLTDQDYPGTAAIEDWPSWNLPILRWAREQNAVVGYAHCAIGLAVDSDELPNYLMPDFGGIGANEAIVDVTHDLVDFLSGAEYLPAFELNAWYHMLNCGFRLTMVGETDYPCISDDRPGVGRSYVQLGSRPVGDQGYEHWIAGLQAGNLYFGDGRSHVLDFAVSGGVRDGREVRVGGPTTVTATATVAALLAPQPTDETRAIKDSAPFASPAWHIERARIGDTREVVVELVVNGLAVARQSIVADGAPTQVSFDVEIAESSWLAIRMLPSSHTHPIFVLVDGAPIRASRRSAEWCRDAVDRLWEAKAGFIRAPERDDAELAFRHARTTYQEIADECRHD